VSEPQSAEAVRAGDRARGPAADEAAHGDLMTAYARLLADKISELLPEGYRLEWK
jgi:hypothetical protein